MVGYRSSLKGDYIEKRQRLLPLAQDFSRAAKRIAQNAEDLLKLRLLEEAVAVGGLDAQPGFAPVAQHAHRDFGAG